MENTKHIPLRMCVTCRTMKPKEELIKLTVSADGLPIVDATGKSEGRGAYICRSGECIKKAQKAGKIGRALRCRDDSGLYDALKSECEL